MQVYIYQADLWCPDCGERIRTRLDKAGLCPQDPENEYSFDSDDYPKGPMDPGPSDSPDHCASQEECPNAITLQDGRRVGALLTTHLTEEGFAFILEALLDGSDLARQVWAYQWQEELDAMQPMCPCCSGDGVGLGVEGTRLHFRCRDCGMMWSPQVADLIG